MSHSYACQTAFQRCHVVVLFKESDETLSLGFARFLEGI